MVGRNALKTFLVSWKIIHNGRYIAIGNVGVYKANKKSELERDQNIMKKAQSIAIPVTLEYAKTHSFPDMSKISILVTSNQIPDRQYPETETTLILDADNEEEAGVMIDAVNEIYMVCRPDINALGMVPNDVLTRYKQKCSDGLSNAQAIDTVITELQAR
jgi:hypothetical protein